jgi:hypothetical protein
MDAHGGASPAVATRPERLSVTSSHLKSQRYAYGFIDIREESSLMTGIVMV